MADESAARRVDIGFTGGQVLSLRMKESDYEGLRTALEDGKSEGWQTVKTEDSEVRIDMAQVVYVRVDTDQHKVGF